MGVELLNTRQIPSAPGERAPTPPELLLSVAERREREDEQRDEALRIESLRERPSARLVETPAQEAAMDALAERREREREQRVLEETDTPRLSRPRAPDADGESRFDPR